MSWISTGLSILGLGMDMYSSYEGAEAAEEAGEETADNYIATGEANAEISRYDASVERLLAMEASYSTNQQVAAHRRNIEVFVGKQRSRYSKSGVYVGGGSALDTTARSIKAGMEDEFTLRNEGRKTFQMHSILATKYDLLAEKGLRESAAYASSAIKAGNVASDAIWFGSAGSIIDKSYEIGKSQDWWN